QGRVVVSVSADKINEFENAIEIPFEKLGTVTSGEIVIDDQSWGNISDWKNKYDYSIEKYLNK
ncbi:MAG: hypothetical protein ABIR50_01895, partial [Ginsengibacter sp.]